MKLLTTRNRCVTVVAARRNLLARLVDGLLVKRLALRGRRAQRDSLSFLTLQTPYPRRTTLTKGSETI